MGRPRPLSNGEQRPGISARRSGALAGMVAVVGLIYVLSPVPVMLALMNGGIMDLGGQSDPPWVGDAFLGFYGPLLWLCDRFPPINDFYAGYAEWAMGIL